MEAEAEDQEEEENWDATSDELSSENLVTPPTDYSGIPTPEEEEEGLAATEASLPTKEDDEGVWFRCQSPCWRVRGSRRPMHSGQTSKSTTWYTAPTSTLPRRKSSEKPPQSEKRKDSEREKKGQRKSKKKILHYNIFIFILCILTTPYIQ